MGVFFGTAITKNYFQKSVAYLSSLKHLKSVQPFCITVGFDFTNKHFFPHVKFIELDASKITCNLSSFICLQYGDFAQVFGDDLLIFTDADAVVQRDLTASEIDRFTNYNNTLGLGHNNFQNDTLATVFPRLIPAYDIHDLEIAEQINLGTTVVYNTGFIVGKTETFYKLRTVFGQLWQKYSTWWKLPAKMQYLICLGIHKLGINVDLLDYGIHSHGHGRRVRWNVTPHHYLKN